MIYHKNHLVFSLKFKIGINSNVYIDYAIDYVIKRVYEMGYEGIEIARTHAIHELSDDKINEIKSMAQNFGLKFYCIQGGIPFTNKEYARLRIDLARKLDCTVVNIGPGFEVELNNKREKWDEFKSTIIELADFAKKYGIKIAIEPEPRIPLSRNVPIINCYRDLLKFLSEVKLNNIGAILDIAHIYVFRENPVYVIKNLGNRIFNVHVSDIIDNRHVHLLPGTTGEVRLPLILKLLNEINYDGFLSIEVYPYFDEPDRAALKSIIYLNDLIYKLK